VLHEELLLPVHQRMMRKINGPVILHICGDITPRLSLLEKTGFACFNFDWDISPTAMRLAARFPVMGNINTTDLLRGDAAAIVRQVRECVAAGVDIISPGCAVSPDCSNASLSLLAKTVT
jgi:[methyl-Co(III) methanol-specific corrinoid protein]:coenzyme M methyltransferase